MIELTLHRLATCLLAISFLSLIGVMAIAKYSLQSKLQLK
jgi:hypothetical protein